MDKPLPSDFQLTEHDLPLLGQQREDLNNKNQQIEERVYFFLLIFSYALLVVILWPFAHGCAFLAAIPASFMTWLILGKLADVLIWRLIREPDENLKRYEAFILAKVDYENWFQRTQEDFWNSLSGAQFEIEVVQLLNRAGFSARLTSGAGDRGVDIVLDDGTIIQCKARQGPCGPAALRELYGSLHDFCAKEAILISREGFTNASIQFVEGKPITLWDRSTLISLQKSLE